MYIDHSRLTQWTVDCRSLETAIDLKQILANFTRGTYELFILRQGRKITVKYGMTADGNQGERMYRQIWRFPGWPTVPSSIASGDDLDDTVIKLLAQYPDLTKDMVYLQIWDMSTLPPLNRLRPELEPYNLEGQLIEEYADREGHAPIGNKLEQRRLERGTQVRKKMTAPPDSLLDHLFE